MVAFGIEFRNLGVSLGSLAVTRGHLPVMDPPAVLRISAIAVVGLYFFLSRSYLGAAIRAISQDREIMTLDGRRHQAALLAHISDWRGSRASPPPCSPCSTMSTRSSASVSAR